MSQDIKKIKITDEGIDVDFVDSKIPNQKKDERLVATVTAKCAWRPHKDFKDLLQELVPHLAYATEQTDKFTTVKKRMEPFKITGYVMGTDGVTLIGQRRLKNGQVLNLTSFFIKFDDQDVYWNCYELADLITDCNAEAKLYIAGKRTPPLQQTMDFDQKDGKAKVVKVITQPKRLNGPNKQLGNG